MSDREHRSIWTHLYDVPFQQGFVHAGGVRTRYVRAGDVAAPPVVLPHGLGGTWENMFGSIREHAKHFNTFAFDMLGHGSPDKPNQTLDTLAYANHLGDFMGTLGIKRASMVGLSRATVRSIPAAVARVFYDPGIFCAQACD